MKCVNTMIPIGHVSELVRYPIKSMAGVTAASAFLGWHGLASDRRFAFRRLGDETGFPWLSASRCPEMVRYQPQGLDERTGEPLPTHVQTPDGKMLELRSLELCQEIAEQFGGGVELMNLKHGIFDDAPISVMSLATIAGIGQKLGMDLDRRRFRANIVLDTMGREPFLEDEWVGGTLVFGEDEPRPAVTVTSRDIRCKMINLDPDTSNHDPRIMKAVAELNQNHAGVYATAVQTGMIHVGQAVYLTRNRS